MKKYKATIAFMVDDDVNHDDVRRMADADLSAGEFFVRNEQCGSEHIKSIRLDAVEVLDERKTFCPKCGSSHSEITCNDKENPAVVYCHCHRCDHRWAMTDPNIPVINIEFPDEEEKEKE